LCINSHLFPINIIVINYLYELCTPKPTKAALE